MTQLLPTPGFVVCWLEVEGPKGVRFEQNLLGSGSCVLVHWVVVSPCVRRVHLQPPASRSKAAGESATTR
jgi:hypothetical protein